MEKNIEKIISFEIRTPINFVPGKAFFDEVVGTANGYNVYDKHANFSNELKSDTSYLIEIYEVLNDLNVREVDLILRKESAIKSGTQSLLLAFQQQREMIPIGKYVVSPEELEILPSDEHGYKKHMGIIRHKENVYHFDNGDASAIRRRDCIMITKELTAV